MKSELDSTAPSKVRDSNWVPGIHLDIWIDWLTAAARLPGRSLHVGLCLFIVAVTLRTRIVPLSNVAGTRFGLDRNAKYRGLAWLEKSGLVTVKRKLGRSPMVTILDLGERNERQP
jgi:hypothetical protein